MSNKSEKPNPYLKRGAYKGAQAAKVLYPKTGDCVGGVTLRTYEPLPIPKGQPSDSLPISATTPTFSYDPLFGNGKIKLPKYGDFPGLPSQCRASYQNKLVAKDSFAADWDRGY